MMMPKIKDGVSVIYRQTLDKNFEVNFLINRNDSVYPFIFNELSFRILRLFNGKNTQAMIAKKLHSNLKEVIALEKILSKKGLLVLKGAAQVSENSSQLNFLSVFETPRVNAVTMQKKISRSRVAVIGLGGIGTWVVKSLALSGVTKFTLVDPDCVDMSNLNRQCLYTYESIGQPKTVVASQALRQLNISSDVTAHRKKIESMADVKGILRNVDLVINCADEPSTDEVNRIVTRTCYPLRIPHILCGGYDGHLGFVGPTIIPRHTPCWICYEKSINALQKKAGYRHLLLTEVHEKGGTLAAISSIVGNIHALEALKLLSGFSKPTLTNQVVEMDFLRLQMHYHPFRKQANCKIC